MPPPPLRQPRKPNGLGSLLRSCGRGLNLIRLVIVNLVFFALLFIVLLAMVGIYAGSRMARDVRDDSVLVLQPAGRLVEQYSIAT